MGKGCRQLRVPTAIITAMAHTDANELIAHIQQDMRQAMKAGKRIELEELRSLLARISNAEAVVVQNQKVETANPIAGAVDGVGRSEAQRKTLTLADVQAIVQAEKQEIETTLSQIDTGSDYAAVLSQKLAAIQKYMR